MSSFPALTGFYKFLFLYLEPCAPLYFFPPSQILNPDTIPGVLVSTTLPAIMILTFPGAAWFYHELVPSVEDAPAFLETRANIAIVQLGNCAYLRLDVARRDVDSEI